MLGLKTIPTLLVIATIVLLVVAYMRKRVGILSVLWVVAFFGFFAWHHITYMPATRAKIPKLQGEAARIDPPPGDTLTNQFTTYKSGHALVECSYTSRLSYPELRSYYDAEFSSNGWTFGHEHTVFVWGKDLGGKSACYSKGEDVCDLFYPGPANSGYTYALDFSWGLTPCK